jgi:putative MFS transporter
MMAASAAGLLGIVWLDHAAAGATVRPLAPVALLIFGSNGMLAVLLPYTAELFPARIRGRAIGLVAGCTKLGGLAAQILGLLALVPSLALAAWAIIGPLAVSIASIVVFGEETRGRDLRRLDDGAGPALSGRGALAAGNEVAKSSR